MKLYCTWCNKFTFLDRHYKQYHPSAYELGIKDKENWYKYLKSTGKWYSE